MIKTLTIINYVINILIIISMIFFKRERPEKVMGWLLFLLLIPPVGLIFYLFTGINWKNAVLSEKFSPEMSDLISKSIKEYDGSNRDIARLVSNTNNSPMFLRNKVKIYKDGVSKFKDLISDIENAKHHVHLEYYIVKSDELGRSVLDACIKKAQEGVKVRVVIDKIGGRNIEKSYRKKMMDSGIELVSFTAKFAFVSKLLDLSLNYRLHRKIAVIDGKIGYIGGNNIGDEYVGKSKYGYWRDTHLRIEGDFVLGLQAQFLDDFLAVLHRNEHAKTWEYYKRKEIYRRESNLEAYFPISTVDDFLPMQLAYSGPESPLYTLELLYFKLINNAKERIYISTPYFIPSEGTLTALKTAIKSGVDVRIMFPEQFDHVFVSYASMSYLGELIEIGARVYLYDINSFAHNKCISVDGTIFSTGTANFDVRSFFFNYECNAVVYDQYLTSKIEGMFYDDISKARELTLSEYLKRPKYYFMRENFSRVFSILF